MRAVGVLAVMDDAADALFDAQRHSQSADVNEARAAVVEMLAALREVETYLEEREDVVDGAYGQPKANTEMTLLREVRAAIAKAQP